MWFTWTIWPQPQNSPRHCLQWAGTAVPPCYSLWEMITDDVSKVLTLYTEKKEKRLQEIMVEHKRYWFSNGSSVKHLPAIQETHETRVPSPGQEYPLEEELAAHCSILDWRIPWREEPGRLQSTRLHSLDTTEWANKNSHKVAQVHLPEQKSSGVLLMDSPGLTGRPFPCS